MNYILDFNIVIEEAKSHYRISVDGEILAYYEKDQRFPDGFSSYIKIKFSDNEFYSQQLRISDRAIPVFKRELLARVRLKGHFSYGGFNSKKYIN
jgi:hypothetical protein